MNKEKLTNALEATLRKIQEREGEANCFTPNKERYFYSFPCPSREQLSCQAQSAKGAQEKWQSMEPWAQKACFNRLYDLIEASLDPLIDVLRSDTQKPKQEVLLHEIVPFLDGLKLYPKLAQSVLKDRKQRSHLLPTQRVIVRQVPYGVVGLISPWNFPFYLAGHSILQAVAAGNAVIHKPSEHTPLTGLLLQTLFELAQFPENLITTVFGDGIVGQSLVLEPDIRKIGFIGSTRTGRHILKHAADRILPVSLELGGKDALLVTQDADLDLAAQGAAAGAFSNSGQACTSTERIYVDQKVLTPFTEKLVAAVHRLSQSDMPLGPMITGAQLGIVQEQIEDAQQKGAKILTGGTIDRRQVTPTVITEVTEEMLLLQEETFGPLVAIIPFEKEETAIKEINRSPYGLSGAVFCRNEKRAVQLASQIESGHVMINSVLTSPSISEAPWGGFKQSGLGRTNGVEGLKSYTQTQSIIVDQVPRISGWFAPPYRENRFRWIRKLAGYLRWLPVWT